MTLVKAVTTTNDLTVLVALRECSMPMLRDGLTRPGESGDRFR
jgi:hypothetical protein